MGTKDIKIVVGANYGDEGKGLMTRFFVKEAQKQGKIPVVIFHNGTAQRGHTVDYAPGLRHVYHHFGSGTADKSPTFFAESFLVHPMEYRRELQEELLPMKIIPHKTFCHPNCKVITPFDMIVDRATEEYIAMRYGEREYGSCGFGSWCAAEDRIPMGKTAFTVKDFWNIEATPFLMEEIWKDCISILIKRGVDIEKTSFAHLVKDRTTVINNFISDVKFFNAHNIFTTFEDLWNRTDSFIFENGQGLGLDMHVNNDWHTTSNTGIINPYEMLRGKSDFNAEVCYVTRSYLTRHGVGPLEEAVKKTEINADMHDRTNVYNEFQGDLRYGYLEDKDQAKRIAQDFSIAGEDKRFKKTMAITHTNEFDCGNDSSEYYSDNPFGVIKREE